MSTVLTILFNELATADLLVDAVYKGKNSAGNAGDDPINKLLGVANMGGFRVKLSLHNGHYAFIVLYSNNSDADWPDYIDPLNGMLIYYGDNKKPGYLLEETPRGGNRILGRIFELAHGDRTTRAQVPPIFVFTKGTDGRDVCFRGLCVPGAPSISQTEDLTAIWKIKEGQRFQNYRAVFTILDAAQIPRQWIMDLLVGNGITSNAPRN